MDIGRATIASEEGRSKEEISTEEKHCRSSEALAEWRSSEHVENGITSTSPPYWDSDDDDSGPKPSKLYGKFPWKIEKFSQIKKRELRSDVFEVGGYKWYILIYPQGCDVCNHLSLFLCVANHEKLLPGWSHFAQFTIAVVNKDPKKSKYSDTLHRFWKKEHDWGWKKFIELSKLLDGFLDDDTLIIRAQVQLLRVRQDRPFRCLDRQYRRELVRVYFTNVEQACRRFVEEHRSKLGNLIEDKARWSSFCAFWLGMDQNSRRHMSEEKSDAILKVVVKNFFIEKEVTSTLVMDTLYSGLKALESQHAGKKGSVRCLDLEEQTVPIVRMEKDTFVLVDDMLLLLERAITEPLPLKVEKGLLNRTKDETSGDDPNKDSIEQDERRLTELGCRTIEIVVMAQIFSKIEGEYKEAVALKRQEELIREEEEAAWIAGIKHKSKQGTSEKEKKSKKKQAKQKRNNRKMKNTGKVDEKSSVILHDKAAEGELSETEGNEYMAEEMENVVEKPSGTHEKMLAVSDFVESVPGAQINHQDFAGRDVRFVGWDIDFSELHPSTELSFSGSSSFSSTQNGKGGRRSPAVDDSSSTCSTDSTPSVVTNAPYSNHKDLKSPPIRGKNHRHKSDDFQNHQLEITDMGHLSDTPGLSSHEQPAIQKEVVVLQLKGHNEAYTDGPSVNGTSVLSPPPPKEVFSKVKSKSLKSSAHSNNSLHVNKPIPNVTDKLLKPMKSSERYVTESDSHRSSGLDILKKPSSEKPTSHVASKPPLSAPVTAGHTPVASIAHTQPFSARSFVPRSYRNAMMGSALAANSVVNNTSNSFSQTPHALQPFLRSSAETVPSSSSSLSFSYGTGGVMHSGPQWMESSPQRDKTRNYDSYKPVENGTRDDLPSRHHQSPTGFTDEFPHLDIINDLLDDGHGLGMGSEQKGESFHSFSNGGYSGSFVNGIRDTHQEHRLQNSARDGLIPNHWQMVGSNPYNGTSNGDTGYPYHMIHDYTMFPTSSGL
ncbi:unnamed protein product [Cuscuta campestris]|uniref:MATH domain-containing protein n=1 Tax=Cuscuta campestris TaxID=132261 RepID=A0A484MGH8_9ASTE|nr:unnamed protein product [Cuscuta campestris]